MFLSLYTLGSRACYWISDDDDDVVQQAHMVRIESRVAPFNYNNLNWHRHIRVLHIICTTAFPTKPSVSSRRMFLSDIIRQRRLTLTLFGHVAHIDTHIDTWRLLTALVPDAWRRPRQSWLSNIPSDLLQLNPSFSEAPTEQAIA